MQRRTLNLALALILTLLLLPAAAAHAQETSHFFGETGHSVQGRFLQYWNAHGGLAIQGYPISDPLAEQSDQDGQTYVVQYFERAEFQLHQENQPPNDVLLSQLGAFRYQALYPGGAAGQVEDTVRAYRFLETGKTLGDSYGFRTYWQRHGGLAQFGLPLSGEFSEVNSHNGSNYQVQYFERAVFEYHPENQGENQVLLTQLGTIRWQARSAPAAPPALPPVAQPTPAPATPGQVPPTATALPAVPTTTPQPAAGPLTASANVDQPNPGKNARVTVTGKLNQAVPGATMNTTWHYKTTTSNCAGTTDGNGTAACTRDISRATAGYTVIIDVDFSLPDGRTAHTQTSFTPH